MISSARETSIREVEGELVLELVKEMTTSLSLILVYSRGASQGERRCKIIL